MDVIYTEIFVRQESYHFCLAAILDAILDAILLISKYTIVPSRHHTVSKFTHIEDTEHHKLSNMIYYYMRVGYSEVRQEVQN